MRCQNAAIIITFISYSARINSEVENIVALCLRLFLYVQYILILFENAMYVADNIAPYFYPFTAPSMMPLTK